MTRIYCNVIFHTITNTAFPVSVFQFIQGISACKHPGHLPNDYPGLLVRTLHLRNTLQW